MDEVERWPALEDGKGQKKNSARAECALFDWGAGLRLCWARSLGPVVAHEAPKDGPCSTLSIKQKCVCNVVALESHHLRL